MGARLGSTDEGPRPAYNRVALGLFPNPPLSVCPETAPQVSPNVDSAVSFRLYESAVMRTIAPDWVGILDYEQRFASALERAMERAQANAPA
jgi:hypothetical protein